MRPRFAFEKLESRRVLASFSLSLRPAIDSGLTDDVTAIRAADFDLDGDSDIVTTDRSGGVGFYENIDAGRAFGDRELVAVGLGDAHQMEVHDFDQDGDFDVLVVARFEAGIYLLENVGTPERFELLSIESASRHKQVRLYDWDQDGDTDVLFDRDGAIWWLEWHGDGFVPETLIVASDLLSVQDIRTFDVGDLDGDDDADLAIGSDTYVRWLEQVSNDPLEFVHHEIPRAHATTIQIVDHDANGTLDVVYTRSQGTVLEVWRNTQGDGILERVSPHMSGFTGFGDPYVVDMDLDGVPEVFADQLYRGLVWGIFDQTDARYQNQRRAEFDFLAINPAPINDDVLPDIVAFNADTGELVWLENRVFVSQRIVSLDRVRSPHGIRLSDVDTDGDLDFVTQVRDPHRRLVWYENVDGLGTVGRKHVISAEARFLVNTKTWQMIDVDRDGDPDMLAALNGALVWIENPGSGHDWVAHHVILDGLVPDAIDIVDLDADDVMDVVGMVRMEDGSRFLGISSMQVHSMQLTWDKLLPGHFTTATTGDIDSDGDLDIVAHRLGSSAVWFENSGDNLANLGETVHNIGRYGDPMVADDFDQDGDTDLFLWGWWLEAVGDGSFVPHELDVSRGSIERVQVADIDHDGDKDLVFGPEWLENREGNLTWRHKFNYSGRDFGGGDLDDSQGLTLGDLDGDGDPDLVFADAEGQGLRWRVNQINDPPVVDVVPDGRLDLLDLNEICAAIASKSDDSRYDVNGDNRLDSADAAFLHRDMLGTSMGDINLDGRFDSSDLVLLFQRGEYEDDVEDNSRWSTGDWNCDGEFDSADLIEAFRTGDYVS